MTQPAKVQEPSMEEILASIRRIIADDEAKPAAGAPVRTEGSASSVDVMDVPRIEAGKRDAIRTDPARIEPAKPAPLRTESPKPELAKVTDAAKPAAAARPLPVPPGKPAPESNNQNDIDALLAGLDETTVSEEAHRPRLDGDVFELTDDMALPDSPAAAAFRKVDPDNDLEFYEPSSRMHPRDIGFSAAAAPAAVSEPSPQIMSQATVSAVESAFNSLATTVLSNNARTLEDLVKEMLRPMLKSWIDDNLPGLVERIVKAEIERVSRGR